jgi:uncharacterized protein YegP (UPF0339 family)
MAVWSQESRRHGESSQGSLGVRFQCYRTTEDAYYWRMLSKNHRIVAIAPGGFDDVREARAAAELVRASAAEAMVDLSSDRGVAWQWTMRVDGEVIAVSAHDYGRRVEALAAAERFRLGAGQAPIVDRILELGHDLGIRDIALGADRGSSRQ